MKLTDEQITALRDTYDDWRKGQGTDYYRIETIQALATEALESRAEIARLKTDSTYSSILDVGGLVAGAFAERDIQKLTKERDAAIYALGEWGRKAGTFEARVAELEEVAVDVMASLAAAISLLERGGKKAAASDKMFAQMLVDYNASLDRARAALWMAEP
jgi:hypothetical protein